MKGLICYSASVPNTCTARLNITSSIKEARPAGIPNFIPKNRKENCPTLMDKPRAIIQGQDTGGFGREKIAADVDVNRM